MAKYLIKRLFNLFLVILGITFISFFLANISPIDPAEAYAKRTNIAATEEQIEKIKIEMGLNQPIYQQYINWITKALNLDFGTSFSTHQPVSAEILPALGYTFQIVGVAAMMILIVSVPLGIFSAYKKGKAVDHFIRILSILGMSLPGYWSGYLFLLFFAVMLRTIPVIGEGSIGSVIIAGSVLAIPAITTHTRMLRTSILEVINKDYVLYARARGVSEFRIIYNYLLRSVAPSMITLYGQSIGYLLTGTAVVETIFSCPGIGMRGIAAALARDLPVINAYILIAAFLFVMCNTAVDVLGKIMDPRLRKELRE